MGSQELSGRNARVTVLGFDGSPPSPQARRALAEATLVVGNIRHLDALPIPETARRIYMGGLGSALTHLALHDGPAVVVASGDPGFFGVVRALREQEIRVRTLPAISSVAAAFGRIGMAWEDALVVAVDAASDGVDPTERTASSRSRFRATRAICAPASASALAMASPRPRLPPVMTAVLPVRSIFIPAP